jgi:hypothetical protein
MDIFRHECEDQGIEHPRIHKLLARHPGKDLENVKVSNLVNAVKGLAYSFEGNSMFGQGDLASYADAQQFLDAFLERYTAKAMKDVESTKRDKATDPRAVARAEDDRHKVLAGLEHVRKLFQG